MKSLFWNIVVYIYLNIYNSFKYINIRVWVCVTSISTAADHSIFLI